MLSRRLLVVLIIFILLAGIGIASGQIFVVRHIEPTFVNDLAYIRNREHVYSQIRSSLGFVQGRSILFSLDRDRVQNTIEDVDYRVRVTNIEAVFPNTLRINVRERYPVFRFDYNGQVLILDSQLRFVTDDLTYVNPDNLININNQLSFGTRINDHLVDGKIPTGTFLHDFLSNEDTLSPAEIEQLVRIDRLRDLAELFFWANNLNEDSQVHLFSSFIFNHPDPDFSEPNNLYLKFRNDDDTTIRIRNLNDSTRFIEKIQLVWDVWELLNLDAYHYIAEFCYINNRVQVIGRGGAL